MERWDISLHSVGKSTGLRVNGSSIKKNKKIKNKSHEQAEAASKSYETASAPSGKTSSDKDTSIRWENLQIKTTRENEISNVQYGFVQAINMKKHIIIDTGYST